jgi:endonuclease-3
MPTMSKGKGSPTATQSEANPSAQTMQELLPNSVMERVLETLDASYPSHPMGELTAGQPYKVLVACLLSLRTQDTVSIPASKRLFATADTPQEMVTLSQETIERIIFPTGFYKNKARDILAFSQRLLDEFNGEVPSTIDELLTLKGVGRKTANLVVGLGFGLPAICVDVHVHRICNRLGYLQTKTPEETETALREKLPPPFWLIINRVMVMHGQQTCRPIGPRCDICPVAIDCRRVDVTPRTVKRKTP